jgi:Lrp/AsnC family transcriptional regulator, leucine-responsive regulatory protein
MRGRSRQDALRFGVTSSQIGRRRRDQKFYFLVDPKVFGLGTSAFVRMCAIPGQVKKLEQMLYDSPEVVEADRVTGEDCILAKFVAGYAHELQNAIDRFQVYTSADTAIILTSVVARRRPKL